MIKKSTLDYLNKYGIYSDKEKRDILLRSQPSNIYNMAEAYENNSSFTNCESLRAQLNSSSAKYKP